MQDYTNYIIGALVLGAIVFLIYTSTSKQVNVVVQNNIENNATATTEVASTTENMTENTASSTGATNNTKTENNSTKKFMNKITMTTNKGVIVLQLNPKIAPQTVENFEKLASSGFYNGVKFHRVIKGFMIQGGDPNSKDNNAINTWGMGGPGYKFADEIFDAATYQKGYKRGILAMANSGPNTNGSQFFIMHADYPLPPSYTIFGQVLTGLDTVDSIANTQTVANDRPAEDIVILKVAVE
jgi:cyclophilin family peptidyl-prolyl cis-trans isomerase